MEDSEMEKRALSDEEVEAVLRGEVPAGRGDLIDLAVAMQEVREAVPTEAPVPSPALVAWLNADRRTVHAEPSVVRRTRPRAVAWIAGLGLGAQAALGATGAAAVGAGAGLTGVLPSEAQLLVDDFLGLDRTGDEVESTDGDSGAPGARTTTGATDAGSPSDQQADGDPADGAETGTFGESGEGLSEIGDLDEGRPGVQPGGQSTDVAAEPTEAGTPVDPSGGGSTDSETAGETDSGTPEGEPTPTPAETPTDPPPGTPAEPGETETPDDGVTDEPTDEAPEEPTPSGPEAAPLEPVDPAGEETATDSDTGGLVGEEIGEEIGEGTGGRSAEGGGGTETDAGQGAAGRGSGPGVNARSDRDDHSLPGRGNGRGPNSGSGSQNKG